jgi:hypothetical protein
VLIAAVFQVGERREEREERSEIELRTLNAEDRKPEPTGPRTSGLRATIGQRTDLEHGAGMPRQPSGKDA